MNHWFLCARDVMWFCLAVAPMFLSVMFGMSVADKNQEMPWFGFVFVAATIQFTGIVLLLAGVIK